MAEPANGAAGPQQQWQYEDNTGGNIEDRDSKFNQSPTSKNNTMFSGTHNFGRGGGTNNFLEDTGETRVR